MRYLTLKEFCAVEGYSESYVQKLATRRLLPLKMFLGKPVKPFRIDMVAYQQHVSTSEVHTPQIASRPEKKKQGRTVPPRKEAI